MTLSDCYVSYTQYPTHMRCADAWVIYELHRMNNVFLEISQGVLIGKKKLSEREHVHLNSMIIYNKLRAKVVNSIDKHSPKIQYK